MPSSPSRVCLSPLLFLSFFIDALPTPSVGRAWGSVGSGGGPLAFVLYSPLCALVGAPAFVGLVFCPLSLVFCRVVSFCGLGCDSFLPLERRGLKSYSPSIALPHPVTEGGGGREHGPVFLSVALNSLGVVIGVAVYFPFPSCPPPAKWR